MDLLNLSTSENEQNGKWFRVELYGKEQSFALKLVGSDNDKVIAFQREQLRKVKSLKKEVDELTDEEMAELLDIGDEAIISRIVGISAIKCERKAFGKSNWEIVDEELKLGDTVLGNDEDSYRLLIEKIPAIKDFILEKTKERSNFLS